MNLAESITKKFEASADSCKTSFYALRAFLWSFFCPQTPTGWQYEPLGSHQPTLDPSFSLVYMLRPTPSVSVPLINYTALLLYIYIIIVLFI